MRGGRVRYLPGLSDYRATWEAMRRFADDADDESEEEIWLLQHPPIYTLGRGGDQAHLLRENGIPLARSDRGGQITYHGPGQIVAYVLLNLRRRRLGARELARRLEGAVVALLAARGVRANGDEAAPGVYVGGAKIAALGLRLRRGWTYHGLSLNVDADLAPFADINPCGFAGLAATRTRDWGIAETAAELMPALAAELTRSLFGGEGAAAE